MAKSKHETQLSEDLRDESLADILSSVDQFIENVYRDLDMTPAGCNSSRNSSQFHSTVSPVGAASLSPSDENVSPSRRLNLDAEVERINVMCDRVEMDLRSIDVDMNSSRNSGISNILSSLTSSVSTLWSSSSDDSSSRVRNNHAREIVDIEMPRPIIDLSESQTDVSLHSDNTRNNNDEEDDDVIIVSSNIQPVVDLCTPSDMRERSRRHRRHLTARQRLAIPDPNNVDTCMEDEASTARKSRRAKNKKSLDASMSESTENNSYTETNTPDRSRYTCAVCLESYFQRRPTTTRCGHVFCQRCIKEAIRLTRKCPMCNAKVGLNQIYRLYL